MLFPENTNNEYIIKSDYRGYGGETSSSYHAHDDYGESGEDIDSIGHLLVWHNEKIIIIIFYNLQKE